MIRSRRLLIGIHLWLGLVLGGFWAVQGLSGAWLVIHRDVEAALATPLPAGAFASLDRVVREVGGEVVRIRIAGPDPDRLEVDLADTRTLVVAVATGERVAGPPSTIGAFNDWLYALHKELLGGKTGKTIVGISGLVLLGAALTGLWIAWPRRGAWREAFAASRWRTRRIKLWGWHRASGLATTVALVVLSISGSTIVFSAELRSGLAAGLPYERPYIAEPVAMLAAPRVGAQAAWRIAAGRFPDARFVRLTFPSTAAPVWVVRMHRPGEWRGWSGTTSVTIDPATGTVLDTYDAARAPLANRLLDGAFAIHSGEVAGWPGRMLVALAGLSLPMFWVTGVWAWLRRRRRVAPPVPMRLAPAE